MVMWPELANSEEVVRVCCHQICGLSHFLLSFVIHPKQVRLKIVLRF